MSKTDEGLDTNESVSEDPTITEAQSVAAAFDAWRQQEFGAWWRQDQWPRRSRVVFNTFVLGAWVKALANSRLWQWWTTEQQSIAVSVITTSCNDSHPDGTFGIIIPASPEQKQHYQQLLGPLFAKVGSPSLPTEYVQALLEQRGIAVRAEEALFLNSPDLWDSRPDSKDSQPWVCPGGTA